MLTAISAPPGSGKSLWCVELLETTVRKNPNRMIFTNIIGINIPGVLPITSSSSKPFDWRDLPDGSLIVFDEAHEHPAFSKTDLLKSYQLPKYVNDMYDNEVAKILDYPNLPTLLKIDLLSKHGFVYTELPLALKIKEQEQLIQKVRNLQKMALDKAKEDILDIGRALTMHRHFGFDIVLVTQKPDLLNAFVKAATSEHLILRRLFKMQLAIIYSYSEIQDSFGNATRKNALSWKIWFFPKKLFKYYISAEQHTASASIPWLIKAPVFLFLCMLAYSIYRAMSTEYGFFKNTTAQDIQENTKSSASPAAETTNQNNQTAQAQPQQIQDLSNICRKAVNVEMPECVKWFDDLSKNGGSIGQASAFNYDGSKPFDIDYTPSDLQPKDFPRFKNAMVYQGKCTAFSQQGTIMHNVSQKDCYRLASGDRPFDYFADQKQQQPQQAQQTASDSDANYKNALYETMIRIESERMNKSQTAQVQAEPLPLGSNAPSHITGAHAL